MSVLFITHDIATARYIGGDGELYVIYRGQVVESGPTESVISGPIHPYTQSLLSAIPVLHGVELPGPDRVVPTEALDESHDDSGCLFARRCPFATERCTAEPARPGPRRRPGARLLPPAAPQRDPGGGRRVKLREALTWDADVAEALVDRLVTPPEDRRWTSFAFDDGVVFASMSSQEIGHIDLLAVDPAARRRGVGRRLVLEAERWAISQGAREMRFAGNPPCYAWPGIDVRYTPALCLAESLGYEKYQTACNMTVDLTQDFSGDLPVSGDRAGVAEFVRENWNEAWAWEAAQRRRLLSRRAGRGDRGIRRLGDAPLVVRPHGDRPGARGLGIGTALLRRCLADMAATGLTSAEIAWVGPIPFYAKAVGARVERIFWLYRKEFS